VNEEWIPYREVRGVFRPLVMLTFAFPGGVYDHLMLVDTGADNIVLPRSIMEPLGIEPAQCRPVWANMLAGMAEGLEYTSASVSFPDYWPDDPFAAPVVFSPARDGHLYGLLGREPLLNHFQCRFGHGDGHGLLPAAVLT